MKPTTLNKIARWCGCADLHSSNIEVEGASVDSRLTKRGDLFFALPGACVDGHQFLEDAAKKGAKAAVVASGYKGDSFGLPLIYVNDVLGALQNIARQCIQEKEAKIVAVTGSVGKTTTKEFIADLLRFKFSVESTQGNQNSQIGLPLTILNQVGTNPEICVLEMGMTHAGDISKLVAIAPPDVAVITEIALVHAWNFDSLPSIARSKAEIFGHPHTKLGIFHYDLTTLDLFMAAGNCEKFTYSVEKERADFFLSHSEKNMQAHCFKKKYELPLLNVLGCHNRQNFLAAATVAYHLGMTWQEISQAMPSLKLPDKRLQVVEKFGATFVNDSYNACEISLKAALSTLPSPKQGSKRIAIIGKMTELGKFSEECHERVGKHALSCVDKIICLGDACEPIFKTWYQANRQEDILWKQTREEVVLALKQLLKKGDVILLKGSCSNELWKVLEEL